MSLHPEIQKLIQARKVLAVNKPDNPPCLPGAYCHKCDQVTGTVYLPLSSGHIGNCCAECRATRKGKPFVSKRKYENLNTPIAERSEGDTQATAIR